MLNCADKREMIKPFHFLFLVSVAENINEVFFLIYEGEI